MPSRKTTTRTLIALIVLGLSGAFFFLGGKKMASAADAPSTAIPVTMVRVVRQDVPIYLNGLGKVQAITSATIRSQVDGQITAMPLKEGQEVKAGDLLVQIDPRPYQAAVDQAAGKEAQDQAQLESARKLLERDRELAGKGLVDAQTLDSQQASTNQLEAAVKGDTGALALAKLKLEWTRIVSPIDGRVGLRDLDPGNIVRASADKNLAMVTQMHPIAVVFTLSDSDLGKLPTTMKSQGDRAVVSALERGTGEILDEGKLTAIDNQIDAATGTIRLKAKFKNEKMKLWPGQFVDARLLIEERKGAIVVPAVALQDGPNGTYVFVVNQEQRVEIRLVGTEARFGDLAVIDKGLREGEQVVTVGQYLLRDKSRVRSAE